MKYYSQKKQDYFIDRLFNRKQGGTFVDIGAHDGVTYSNTCFLERSRNWKGVCIEPIPEVFEELQKNRSCYLVNGAVSDTNEVLEFKRVHGYSEMLSGVMKFREATHEARTRKELSEYGGDAELISVQGHTLDSVLRRFSLHTVDYLSLDIEGGEYEVLRSIDFSKTRITSLTVENNYSKANIRQLMKDNGYIFLFRYAVDDFYVKPAKIPAAMRIPEIRRYWIRKFNRKVRNLLHLGEHAN